MSAPRETSRRPGAPQAAARRPSPPRVLVVDDHVEMTRLLRDQLADEGYDVVEATSGEAAIELLRADPPDVVVADLRMAGKDGLDVLAAVRERDPDLPVLIMTAFGSIDSAVEAMRRGAFTYLTKPFRLEELVAHLGTALRTRGLEQENRSLRRLVGEGAPHGLVGQSAAMRRVHELIGRLADAEVPVLVRGESGTGKERVARALHLAGARASRPFVALNCAGVPGSLLESELFGHVRGAFTGATNARRGLFLEADGGTLFLDEIGDMPLELQGHLLRVLEDGLVRPVGSDVGRAVDVRIVAATHQPLEAAVEQGRFRRDLFFRLDVVSLHLPPLRDRLEDLPELFAAFATRFRPDAPLRPDPAALALLERHPWPGNVRELENLVRRLAVLVDGDEVHVEHLRLHAGGLSERAGEPRRGLRSLREVQDEHIAWVLEQCGGNKTQAAAVLGIDVSTLHRRERSKTAP